MSLSAGLHNKLIFYCKMRSGQQGYRQHDKVSNASFRHVAVFGSNRQPDGIFMMLETETRKTESYICNLSAGGVNKRAVNRLWSKLQGGGLLQMTYILVLHVFE